MISRRAVIATGVGVAVLSVAPAMARSAPSGLLIVNPDLLSGAPPRGTLVAGGHGLMDAVLPQLGGLQRIDGLVCDADARMLAELVRFIPGFRLEMQAVPAGVPTVLGKSLHRALLVTAIRA